MPGRTGKYDKLNCLKEILANEERIALAYSGGMDSAFLLWYLTRINKREQTWAVHFVAGSTPKGELVRACRISQQFGARLLLLPAPEAGDDLYLKNDSLRCYYCKKARFSTIREHVLLRGFQIADGTQLDDLKEDRPGMQAGKELGVMSPLLEAGIGKADILSYADKFSLPLIDMVPESCLATRIATGETITAVKVKAIDEAEYLIKRLGFKLVRIRSSNDRASLEFLPAEMSAARNLMQQIIAILFSHGWSHVDPNPRVYGGMS